MYKLRPFLGTFKNIRPFLAKLWTFDFSVILLSYLQIRLTKKYHIFRTFYSMINLQHTKNPFLYVKYRRRNLKNCNKQKNDKKVTQ